jgi:hypothetical protein
MSTRPDKSKEQLIAEERAAEAAVVKAEYALREAQTIGPDATAVQAARSALDTARAESFKTRQTMIDGLAQWHEWDSQQELARTARELGIA